MAALAKPGPISSASSAPDTGLLNSRTLPSGNVMRGMSRFLFKIGANANLFGPFSLSSA